MSFINTFILVQVKTTHVAIDEEIKKPKKWSMKFQSQGSINTWKGTPIHSPPLLSSYLHAFFHFLLTQLSIASLLIQQRQNWIQITRVRKLVMLPAERRSSQEAKADELKRKIPSWSYCSVATPAKHAVLQILWRVVSTVKDYHSHQGLLLAQKGGPHLQAHPTVAPNGPFPILSVATPNFVNSSHDWVERDRLADINNSRVITHAMSIHWNLQVHFHNSTIRVPSHFLVTSSSCGWSFPKKVGTSTLLITCFVRYVYLCSVAKCILSYYFHFSEVRNWHWSCSYKQAPNLLYTIKEAKKMETQSPATSRAHALLWVVRSPLGERQEVSTTPNKHSLFKFLCQPHLPAIPYCSVYPLYFSEGKVWPEVMPR